MTVWQIAVLNLLQIAAYEREISKLREDLLREIGHLEERKEEAVKAAASCSAEHFQNLQDQFFSEFGHWISKNKGRNLDFLKKHNVNNFLLSGLQKRLTALPPTLRSMKTDYTSLRSQVRNFSDFYGSAINEAKKQVGTMMWQCALKETCDHM